jgi:hypothetical protein
VEGVRLRALLVALALLAAGCAAVRGGTPTDTVGPLSHAAPDLEALLPDSVESVPLLKSSNAGAAAVQGGAFRRSLARSLRRLGKKPEELRSATAADFSNRISVEIGVFEARGVGARALTAAVVRASRSDVPDLKVTRAVVAGRSVTTLLYPGSSKLYLYGRGDRVFYVGSTDPQQAAGILRRFP